jgi:hypothetical protein
MPFPLLLVLFAGVATLYASIGFGGGSTYTALLIFSGISAAHIPIIALACNIIVVTGGTARFAMAKITPWRRALPLVVVSAPIAFLGALTPVKEGLLLQILGVSLILSALALLVQPHSARAITLPAPLLFGVAMLLAYLAGITGIGGGIFLAPLLHLIRWDAEKPVAATASLFILVNSLFGLAGQYLKLGNGHAYAILAEYWPLFAAVLLGGAIGNHIAVKLQVTRHIRIITALLVGVAGMRAIWL